MKAWCHTCGRLTRIKKTEVSKVAVCPECRRIKEASEANRPDGYNQPTHTPFEQTGQMILDIKHCMEMYPQEEVDAIVRAVNAHEELVQALKGMIEAVHNGEERILREDEIEAIIKARTAIAKAEVNL